MDLEATPSGLKPVLVGPIPSLVVPFLFAAVFEPKEQIEQTPVEEPIADFKVSKAAELIAQRRW